MHHTKTSVIKMAAKYPSMNWDASDVAETFTLFKQRLLLVCEDNEVTDDSKIARKIKISVGEEGLRRINASGLSAVDQKKPERLWDLFEKQLRVAVNFRIERLNLMQYRQKSSESLDAFVTRARTQGLRCEFTDPELQERIIELVIASTPIAEFRRELLDKDKTLTLQETLNTGRRHEATEKGNEQIRTLRESATDQTSIDHVSKKKPCWNCGRHHAYRRCPAFRDECSGCGRQGHWVEFCRSKTEDTGNRGQNTQDKSSSKPQKHYPNTGRQRKNVHTVTAHENETPGGSDTSDPGNYSESFYCIKMSDKCFDAISRSTRDEAYTTIGIKCPGLDGTKGLRLKLDIGAQGNALPVRTFKQMFGDIDPDDVLSPVGQTKLTAYSGEDIKCIGKLTCDCKYGRGDWVRTTFYVVDVPGPVVLGLPMCEALNLVTINCHVETILAQPSRRVDSLQDLKKSYPCQFDQIGRFKDPAKILLKPDAEPYIDRPRKCNVNLLPKIKAELGNMEKNGIIRRVREHTDWCSSIVYSTKDDGSLRVCLDPKHLNNAVKRCPHKTPTLEEINPFFTGAKYFSKLDAKAGYWSVPLEESSQLLTTFRTPIGRYCFQRLPFGLNTSQDIFQQRMDEILEDLDGCVGIADDICVFGSTEDEHDARLLKLMEAAKMHGLVFNSAKCAIKKQSISFFGNVYSKDGISPDPAKVKDIHEMPVPQDREDLQRFLGLLTYLGSFIANLSTQAAILRDLLKKDVPFEWSDDHQHAFEKLKGAISDQAKVAFYDSTKPIALEVDASQKGLGAALIQEGKPIAFASKSLTKTQSNYSNIERETLALVHGVERFHTYLYGRSFTIISDHKPLEMICKKPIISAPPRLQRMLLRILGYDYSVVYRPGEEMVLSDTLSRLPNPNNKSEVKLDLRVDGISFDLISFSPGKQVELRRETQRCPVLNALAEVVYRGWPERIGDLPTDLRVFWSYRDVIGLDDGVLFKGRQIIVPESMQGDIISQLHRGHLGIEKTRLLARDTVYWPRINNDIERLVKGCNVCQEDQDDNRREPMLTSKVPAHAWQIIGTDLFEIKGRQYIIISDYYSKFPIVKELQAPVTSEVVKDVVEEACGTFGRPDEIRSDNGPQYASETFKKFCRTWGINHTTSSPHYAQSNGFIERQIRWVKSVIKKCIKTKENVQMALLNLRATPVDNRMPSPAEMLLGRQVASILPTRQTDIDQGVKDQLEGRRDKAKEHYDHTARDQQLAPLYPGQGVRIQDQVTKTWAPGTVVEKCLEPRSYVVETQKGSKLRRNRHHLREALQTPRAPIPQLLGLGSEDGRGEKVIMRQETQPVTDNTEKTATASPQKAPETAPIPVVRTSRAGRAINPPARYQE